MGELQRIGFYTLTDERARTASPSSPLSRCELVLTDRCNFNCPYCRGLRDDCRGEMPFGDAMALLDSWCDQGLQAVRFSGGEPTLYPGLNRLIAHARERGVERIAVSTNGSATEKQYDVLTECGVNDWSVSLDACCSAFGKKMAGRDGEWERVVENIRLLASATYVTVGIVFTGDNVGQALETIHFAHDLGVADIRVISAAQYNEAIDALADLPAEILDAHPVLKYRVTNHRAGRAVRGIGEHDNPRCPLVMDDIAVAGRWHFPCIIYMREHGEPIGRTTEMSIRFDRWRWSVDHDCHADPICHANCLDVCIDYNNRYRELRP